jgi:hypothetical protein
MPQFDVLAKFDSRDLIVYRVYSEREANSIVEFLACNSQVDLVGVQYNVYEYPKEWGTPVLPMNPDYNVLAKVSSDVVIAAMEREDFYTTHCREDCTLEIARRMAEVEY